MKTPVSGKLLLHFAVSAAIVLLFFSSAILAQSASRSKKIRRMQDAAATAFNLSNLGKLDGRGFRRGKIKLVIEHSLLGGSEQFEARRFQTFRQAERWLQSREQEVVNESGKYRIPFREIRRLTGCRRGVCRYDFFYGILHNHLYLKKIFYGYRKNRPFIKTIYLLCGD